LQALSQYAQHLYGKREGSGAVAGYGSVPLTNGSGSGRSKNMLYSLYETIKKSIAIWKVHKIGLLYIKILFILLTEQKMAMAIALQRSILKSSEAVHN
jgi:hypothetical protein